MISLKSPINPAITIVADLPGVPAQAFAWAESHPLPDLDHASVGSVNAVRRLARRLPECF